MTAPARRHQRSGRPAWRRRADALLAAGLGGLVLVTAAVLALVTVPVVGSGQALLREPGSGSGPQQALILLSRADADGVGPGTEVSVVWGADGDRVDGTVRAVGGPDLLARYGLPDPGDPGGGLVVAEAELDRDPAARVGLPGTATAYLSRRSLFGLFVGRGVER